MFDPVKPAETKPQLAVTKRALSARRLSAAHLSDSVRQRIVALMNFHESAEAAAVAASREHPGLRISARLVIEVAILCIHRKPPASELSIAARERRFA